MKSAAGAFSLIFSSCLGWQVSLSASAPPPLAEPAEAEPAMEVVRSSDEQRISGYVAQLNAPAVADRDLAQEELTIMPEFTLPAAEKALTNSALSPEQRIRIDQIAQAIFFNSPRGALGVQFAATQAGGDGVTISNTIDGFDSRRVLAPGDTVRGVAGKRVASLFDVRSAIVSCDAGEVVDVTILRSGEERTVPVRLGNFGELNQRSGLGNRADDLNRDGTLDRAWAVRKERKNPGGARGALRSPVDAERWQQASALDRGLRILELQETTGIDAEGRPVPKREQSTAVVAGGTQRRLTRNSAVSFDSLDEVSETVKQIRQLEEQQNRWRAQLDAVNLQLEDRNLDPQAQARLRGQVVQINQAIWNVERQIEKVRMNRDGE